MAATAKNLNNTVFVVELYNKANATGRVSYKNVMDYVVDMDDEVTAKNYKYIPGVTKPISKVFEYVFNEVYPNKYGVVCGYKPLTDYPFFPDVWDGSNYDYAKQLYNMMLKYESDSMDYMECMRRLNMVASAKNWVYMEDVTSFCNDM
jgi:hypothetical protein